MDSNVGYDNLPIGSGPGKVAPGTLVTTVAATDAQVQADENALAGLIWKVEVGAFSAQTGPGAPRYAQVSCTTPTLGVIPVPPSIARQLHIQLWSNAGMLIPAATTTASLGVAAGIPLGTVVAAPSPQSIVVTTDPTQGIFSLELSGPAETVYVSVVPSAPALANNGCSFTQAAVGPVIRG